MKKQIYTPKTGEKHVLRIVSNCFSKQYIGVVYNMCMCADLPSFLALASTTKNKTFLIKQKNKSKQNICFLKHSSEQK